MRDAPDGVTWLDDGHGNRIGVEVVESGEERLVRLVFPGGVEKLVSSGDAQRVIAMLQDGVEFIEITGADSFRGAPDDF